MLCIGLLAVAALSVLSAEVYNHNEYHLLDLRARDAGAVIANILPTVETPLASGAELAEATHQPSKFASFMLPYVSGSSGAAVSASLWVVSGGRAQMVAKEGKRPLLATDSAKSDRLVARALRTHDMTVTLIGSGADRRIGFAYSPPNSDYIAYEENRLPANGRAKIASDSSFSGLGYAIYLGSRPLSSQLVSTNEPTLPPTGRTASTVVPFGADSFLLVMAANGSLATPYFQFLWLFIAVVGGLVCIWVTVLVERVVRAREGAEATAGELDALAAENRRMFDEQRDIARTLQHALLPQREPVIDGLSVATRYLPGAAGMEVGGDWYDIVPVDASHFVVVVGDVSGRGLRAATIMAELRFAIRAYAADGNAPNEILEKLNRLNRIDSDDQFATVLCARVDLEARTLEVANAGHLNPLLAEGSECETIDTEVGVPIGVPGGAAYRTVRLDLHGSSTFIAFTDGLVERRSEPIDASMERLRESVCRDPDEALGDLLDRVLLEFGPDGFEDDTALIGIRWLN